MSSDYAFLLNNKEYKVQFSLELFNKLGDAISEELVNKKKYFVQSKVSNESFQAFFDFLNEKSQYPEINMDNYYDYFQLSEEFNKNLSDYLSRQEFDSIKNISILKNASSSESADNSFTVKYIAEHLDFYLEFFSKEMSEIPINTLYNIFHHENRILNNHERAYQWIKGSLSKSGNDNDNNFNENQTSLCVLLNTLDGTKISEQSFNESFSKRDENFGFAPQFSLSFISEIKKQMGDIMAQQMQMMNQMKSLFDQKIDSFHASFQSLAKKLDDTNDEVKKLTQSVANVERDVKTIAGNDERIKEDHNRIAEQNERTKSGIESLTEKVGKIESDIKQIHTENERIDDIWKISLASTGYFDGIIRQLTNECGGNVSDNGIVDVTASSTCWGSPKNVVDFDGTSWFGTQNSLVSWIQYDFKNKKVNPHLYLIKSSANWNKGGNHPRYWVIEGSNSGSSNEWTVLDTRDNCMLLDGNAVTQCFPIEKHGEFYRYLRIRQTGSNVYGNYHFAISSLEYIGSIQ